MPFMQQNCEPPESWTAEVHDISLRHVERVAACWVYPNVGRSRIEGYGISAFHDFHDHGNLKALAETWGRSHELGFEEGKVYNRRAAAT